jgi:hypothetical protein
MFVKGHRRGVVGAVADAVPQRLGAHHDCQPGFAHRAAASAHDCNRGGHHGRIAGQPNVFFGPGFPTTWAGSEPDRDFWISDVPRRVVCQRCHLQKGYPIPSVLTRLNRDKARARIVGAMTFVISSQDKNHLRIQPSWNTLPLSFRQKICSEACHRNKWQGY